MDRARPTIAGTIGLPIFRSEPHRCSYLPGRTAEDVFTAPATLHPAVYQLACSRLQQAPDEICFLSSNGWDAYSAKAFGFRVIWCNRFGQAAERIPDTPDGEITDLSALPALLRR